ncbi:hypothetical protein [Maribellus sediminis]|uniref:hypothetical protein n=1 Tax=Maribellus sediminis TaxID=2696285 RepID=UPI001431BD3C|nr:hypothetical protein [Maribellus sediminis]
MSDKLKKTILLIAGPGALLVVIVALFMHLFTSANTKAWMLGGLLVFFIVFLPFYAIEYFRQEFKKDDKKKVHFKRKSGRTEWHGGNIHGKVPHQTKKPGNLYND